MKKYEEYRFKIDVFTPDTLPMARCAEYLTELSKILVETSSVHFVKVTKGCAQLVSKIDIEAVPKIKEQTLAVKKGNGTPTQKQAYSKMNAMLREDNGTGTFGKGNSKLLYFPGKKEEIIKFPSIRQAGTIDGEIIKIGGSKDSVPIILNCEGKETTGIYAKKSIAKELGKYLFEQVRVSGEGRWERDDDGIWSLIHFTVGNFEPLKESSLSQSILALREIKGEWKEDSLSKILESRHSQREIN
jgi:hypothetical protein